MKSVVEKEMPKTVRDRARSRKNKYHGIYEKLDLDSTFSVCVECDDEDEVAKIASSVRSWAYRQNVKATGERGTLPFDIYIDGISLWIEKKADS
jgi:hypothetical protein